jgi:hypothetical protein
VTPLRYSTFALSGSDELYAQFRFSLRNDGAAPLAGTRLSAVSRGSQLTIQPAELDTLAPGASATVDVSFPLALVAEHMKVRVALSPASLPQLPPVALEPAAFPAGAAPSAGTDSSSSQAALVVVGLLVSVGVAVWCRRRYQQSLEEGAGPAAPGAAAAQGGNPYERVLDVPGAIAAEGPVSPAQQGGLQLGAMKAKVAAALPQRLRKPRGSRGRRGPPSPAAVGLVLGAGTVVATHEEAVAFGYSPGGPRASQAASAGAAAQAPPPEWQEAWQEDDGWDLSDSELLGTDGEAEEADAAPPKPQAADAHDSGKPPVAPAAGAARKSQQDSESDWDS